MICIGFLLEVEMLMRDVGVVDLEVMVDSENVYKFWVVIWGMFFWFVDIFKVVSF